MIKTVRVDISAGNPETPLGDFVAFVGSAISFTLINIPRELGKRVIERVAIEMRDNQGIVRSFEAERVGSAWGATVADDFFTHPCYVKNGVKIVAFGKGNNGEDETWTIGQGDITIIENSVTIQPNDEIHELLVVDGEYLNNPKRGYFDISGMRVFDGTTWVEIGGGGTGATVLTIANGKLYNGENEITQFSALLSLVRAGGVVLLGDVAGKAALFYPLFCDANAVRFDATGTLGSDIKTKSYVMQPTSTGGIRISASGVVDLAKKSDIPTSIPWGSVTGKPSVFPPELVSDLNTRPSDEDAGKTASAQEVFDKLAGKAGINLPTGMRVSFDYFGGEFWLRLYDTDGETIVKSVKLGGDLFAKINDSFAFLSQLGFTAQDITDFLNKFKGRIRGATPYSEGDYGWFDSDILYLEGLWKSLSDHTTHSDFNPDRESNYWEKIDDNSGVAKLFLLTKKSHETLTKLPDDAKDSLFTDTAFIEAVADKLTDADLKTLCTTCGISLTKPDGTPKTRAELLIDLFGESNSQLKATIEANAVIFLETDGTIIKRGSDRIKKFADLLALVQTGRVVLKSTATTSLNSSPVLFRPQLMNSDTILFDATGDISGIMRTRNIKVTKAAEETEEGVDIVVTNGNLQTLIRESDLNARLPYALVSPTDNRIRNRSVNAFTMEGDFSPAFPSPTPDYARDFLINLTVTTAGSFELPVGISSKGDDLSFESGKKYLIAMTEYEERKFLVKLLDITEA